MVSVVFGDLVDLYSMSMLRSVSSVIIAVSLALGVMRYFMAIVSSSWVKLIDWRLDVAMKVVAFTVK